MSKDLRADVLAGVYTHAYAHGLWRHDSPDASRNAMVRRIRQFMLTTEVEHPIILNLGAGAQAIEKQIRTEVYSQHNRSRRARFAASLMISVDVADIPRAKLLNRDYSPHVRADSRQLPFASESIDLVVSNHSVDMLRTEPDDFGQALSEVNRVLKPGSRFDFSLHSAGLFNHLCDVSSGAKTLQAEFYNPSRPNPYFATGEDITSELLIAGLGVTSLAQLSHYDDTWWEADGVKLG